MTDFRCSVASRDDDIRALVERAADTTKVLDARRGDISSLLVATAEQDRAEPEPAWLKGII